MSMIPAIALAATSVVIGIAHSILGERLILGPLSRERRSEVFAPPARRAILRAVWHLPSLAWSAVGIAVLAARLTGGSAIVTLLAIVLFSVSGLANLAALRSPHIGGFLLIAAAALTVADWLLAAEPSPH